MLKSLVFFSVYLVTSILTAQDPEIIDIDEGAEIAGALTCLLCIGITILAVHTKLDFTSLEAELLIFSLFMTVLSFEVSALITGDIIVWLIYFILGIPFWCLLLAQNLQQYMGTRREQLTNPESSGSNIWTTILIFFDILFIYFHCLRSYQIIWCITNDVPCIFMLNFLNKT